ncbi:hypothetical protein P872_18600 [Rhodonellum psychrophilum GCM71 = DSM 17998]|uniref:Uncharacterized protein n=2 Tax=Rhodonellum TaxID=336827 RepID=U5C057_9BACT|nr:hypothetical protein P872_18600 [Rhodonellum psychrophilum GCM71 = DSM 17998]SDZ49025.1 hypothetical protein SAMN05444412_11746 [Rhodonellum ikkaensis]
MHQHFYSSLKLFNNQSLITLFDLNRSAIRLILPIFRFSFGFKPIRNPIAYFGSKIVVHFFLWIIRINLTQKREIKIGLQRNFSF